MLVTAGRIALWQLSAVFVVFALLTGNSAAAGAGCVVLAASAVRVDGRWLDQMLLTYMRYRSQRAHHDGTPLDSVAPGLSTHAYTDRAGNRIGVAECGREWTALLRLEPPVAAGPAGAGVLLDQLAAMLSGPAEAPAGGATRAGVSLDQLAGMPPSPSEAPIAEAAAGAGAVRPASVQLVRWAVPRPGAGSDGAARRRTWDVYWVAVRFDAAADPRAVAARGGGCKGAIAATAVVALRLAIRLRQAGFTARPVEEPELRTELASSLGGQGKDGGPEGLRGGGDRVREAWRWWSVGTLHHATFRVAAPADPARLLAWAAPAPALSTCTAVLLRPKDRGVWRTALIRVAVPAGRKDRTAIKSALRQATRGLRRQLGLKPMNGRQRTGVRATLPLG